MSPAAFSSATVDTVFDGFRRTLWNLCFRLTGSAADADDVVQETFARALEHAPAMSTAQPLEPWLVRVATNLCIDLLRRRRATPYTGPWLPSPVEIDPADGWMAAWPAASRDESTTDGPARYEILESATFAFLLALEALEPLPRAVVVLREVFDRSSRETGDILGIREDHVRTLLHRARESLRSYDERRVRPDEATRARVERALAQLLAYVAANDEAQALTLLAEEARALSDGGGVYRAARVPVVGATEAFRLLAGLTRKHGLPTGAFSHVFNGLPALLLQYPRGDARDAPELVFSIDLNASGRIATIYSVLAPRKLTHVTRDRRATIR